MTPEILAKIMGIVAKTGDRVIVIDPRSGAPFVLMGLDEYEKLTLKAQEESQEARASGQLTRTDASGTMDPDLALWREARGRGVGEWGGDEEEDRYYMEPTE